MNNPNEFLLGDSQSKGSDCCNHAVTEIDGVIICKGCGEPCEEVFEDEGALQERLEDELASMEADRSQDRFERSREEV